MEDKIKVYIPETVEAILLKDMELFEFYKKDGTLNRNDFYNSLIANYYEVYHEQNSDIFDHIQAVIAEHSSLSGYQIREIASDIQMYVETKRNQLEGSKSEVTVSVKPTRHTAGIFRFIESYHIRGTSMSGYFRGMLASYALLPQDKRERIIFKDTVETIEEAVASRRKVYFTTTQSDSMHIVSPYTISNSKEELFNYLVGEYKGRPYSFRLCRLRKVIILSEEASFGEGVEAVLERMSRYAPQFAYRDTSMPEVKVRLSERGKELLKKIYLHRPRCTRQEGDLYWFSCAPGQAMQYFTRFGRHALVLEPADLRGEMTRYYAMADKAYRKAELAAQAEQSSSALKDKIE